MCLKGTSEHGSSLLAELHGATHHGPAEDLLHRGLHPIGAADHIHQGLHLDQDMFL